MNDEILTPENIKDLLSLISFKLVNGNYIKWKFQLESTLDGHDLYGYFDGSRQPVAKYEGETATTTENSEGTAKSKVITESY
jgi:hypothetical protein